MQSNFVPFTIPQKQLCFIHIPKTAGSALAQLMKRVYDLEDVSPYTGMEVIRKLEHGTLDRYRFIDVHARTNIRDYMTEDPAFITFLRDPVKRVISHYRYTKHLGADAPFGPKLTTDTRLEDYLKLDDFRFRVENQQTIYLGTELLYENPPKGYTHHPIATDEIFERAKQTLDSMLFVGIQEQFQESVNLLCRVLGWPSYRDDWKVNVTPGKTEEIPENIIAEIKERNAYDYALYDYAKQLFETRLKEIAGDQSIMKEADRFYDVTFKEQFPPTDHVTYDFRYTPVGSNWHESHRNKEGVVHRHMGPENRSFVDLPLCSDKDMMLSFDVLGSISKDMLSSLQVSVNGTSIQYQRKPRQPGFTYVGRIDKETLAKSPGRARVTFTVDHTVSGKSLGINEDTRLVGPAFSNLSSYPATEKKPSDAAPTKTKIKQSSLVAKIRHLLNRIRGNSIAN